MSNNMKLVPDYERDLDVNSKYMSFTTIEEFGYRIDDESGEVRSIDSNLKYTIPRNITKESQFEEYDWVRIHVLLYVYKKFTQNVKDGGFELIEKWLPRFEKEAIPQPRFNYCEQFTKEKYLEWLNLRKVNIFHSPSVFTTERPIVVFVNGLGISQAGVWSMHLCMTSSLRKGTIFDYLDECRKRNWGVIITNSNHTQTRLTREKIPQNSSNREHILTVYDTILSKCKSNNMMIIAHSFGGCLCNELLDKRTSIMKKLRCMAYTDSVHGNWKIFPNDIIGQDFLRRRCRNWIRDFRPLDYSHGFRDGMSTVSAGTRDHISTSYVVVRSVFRYFEDCMIEDSRLKKNEGNELIKVRKDYKGAKEMYIRALETLLMVQLSYLMEDNTNYTQRRRNFVDIFLSIHSNLVLCLMKSGDYKDAVDKAGILLIENNNNNNNIVSAMTESMKLKCRKIRAFCLIQIGRVREARVDLEWVLKRSCDDKEAKELLEKT